MAGKITGPIRLSKQNCAKGTGMSVPTGWDKKGEDFPLKFPVKPRFPIAFKPVKPVILPKWKAPGDLQNVPKVFHRLGNNVENVQRCPQRSLSITEVKRVMIQ